MSYSDLACLALHQNANDGPYHRPLGLREPHRARAHTPAPPKAAPTSRPKPEIPPDRHPLHPRYAPRKINQPRARLLIDTKYPREKDYQKHDKAASWDVYQERRRFRHPDRPPRSPVKGSKVRSGLSTIIQPDFVIIDGTRTLKRRAQDTEFDLVAANQGLEQRKTLVTAREGSDDPNQEIPDTTDQQQSMLGILSFGGKITKMMSRVFTVFTSAGERVRRWINPQAYEVAELRSNVDGNVRNKRVKLTPKDQAQIEWIDNGDLPTVIDEVRAFRDGMFSLGNTVHSTTGNKQRSAAINRILSPLIHVLADNTTDMGHLHDGLELRTLYCVQAEQLIYLLDKIYNFPAIAKVKGKYSTIPSQFDYELTSSDVNAIHRGKKFLSAPALPTVCKDLLEACKIQDVEISTASMDKIVLDLEALSQGMPLPSLIHSPEYLAKWHRAFPSPQRTDLNHHLLLPGGFPEQVDDLMPEAQPTLPSPPPSEPRDSPEPLSPQPLVGSPPPVIAKTDNKKTAHIRALILSRTIAGMTPGQHRAEYYKESDAHNLIKDTYVTDFEAKEPLKPEEIRQVASILKIRKKNAKCSPKRLHITRAPKTVRFTDSTLSPQPRSHVGLDVPRLTEDGLTPVAEPRVRDSTVTTSPKRLNPLFSSKRRWTFRREEEGVGVDPTVRINEIFALPSFKPLSISDDTRADIANEKEQAALKAAEEARRAAEEARLAAEQQARRELEERLARSGGLRVPTQSLVPPVNEDWNRRARETLRASATTTLAQTPEGVEIRRHDFQKVVPPTEWLNDEIVNGSLVWLDQAINSAAGIKDVRRRTRKCLSMNSFFFKRLREQGVARTERTMRRNGVEKNNFLDVNTIFLPICERSHWTLLVIRPGKKTVAHMDSLNPRGSSEYISLVLAWVKEFLGDKFVEQEWRVVNHEAPLQTNGYDCGVHTITNAMCLALGLSPIDSYTSEDMPMQRIRVASMFLNGGFKGDFDLRVY